ncbi:hypothetical protein [Staphylococcus phage vB_SauM-T-SE-G1]|nr:hypothetical protein [Staphylococcus phage vB_SauM-V1SA15]
MIYYKCSKDNYQGCPRGVTGKTRPKFFYIIFLYNNFFILKKVFTSLYHFFNTFVNTQFYTNFFIL